MSCDTNGNVCQEPVSLIPPDAGCTCLSFMWHSHNETGQAHMRLLQNSKNGTTSTPYKFTQVRPQSIVSAVGVGFHHREFLPVTQDHDSSLSTAQDIYWPTRGSVNRKIASLYKNKERWIIKIFPKNRRCFGRQTWYRKSNNQRQAVHWSQCWYLHHVKSVYQMKDVMRFGFSLLLQTIFCTRTERVANQ